MKIFLIIFLLIIIGCNKRSASSVSTEKIEQLILNEWIYASKLNDIKMLNQEIIRPPGIEQYLFSLMIPNTDGIGGKTHCVFYKVPYQELLGEIRIIFINGKVDCKMVSDNQESVVLKNIQKLIVGYDGSELKLNLVIDNKPLEIKVPLPNISHGKIFSKYDSVVYKKKYPLLSLVKFEEDRFNFAKNRFLGSYGDKYSNKKAIRCLKVNESCEVVGENRCEQCRYGFYEVADVNCPNGGSRFCGINHCGEKDEPACPRGFRSTNEDERGICQTGLVAREDENQILVCH